MVLKMREELLPTKFDLSVITVCRNAKARLQDTVRSVVSVKGETCLKIQHLLIDGASSDGTVALLSEWQEQGKIENYISEPDAGIYDAMNKGVHLSTGKVLYFLNAGDLLLNAESLEACVQPILLGRCVQTSAPVIIRRDGREIVEFPRYEYVYLSTPCCHQGYFATAELYRSLGGYDVSTYRCLADADIMCRAYAKHGMPHVCNKPVAIYPDDGFSSNCAFHYLPEYIRMASQHWDEIIKRCKKDAEYYELVSGVLTSRCMELAKWQQEKGDKIENNLGELKEQLIALSLLGINLMRKCCMLWAALCYLPRVSYHSMTMRHDKMMYWVRIACSMRFGNKYALEGGFPARSLVQALVAKVQSMFMTRKSSDG